LPCCLFLAPARDARQAPADNVAAVKGRVDAAVKPATRNRRATRGQLVDATEPAHVEALYAAARLHATLDTASRLTCS